MDKFEIGDVVKVRLNNAGAPLMSVSRFGPSHAVATGRLEPKESEISCIWFVGGEYRASTFDPLQLELVKPRNAKGAEAAE